MRNEFSYWLRGAGLEIVIIVVVAMLVLRAFDAGARYVERRTAATPEDEVASRTRGAVIQAGRYALSITTGTVAVLLVLSRFSIPLGSLIPVATVAGTGLGFGAQRVVGDFLAGFFLVAERQFGVGDMIKVSAVGAETGIVGVVEEVTLRVTRIRRLNGDIVVFPNSELRQVSNMSRDWARVLVEVPVPAAVNIERVTRKINQIGQALYEDEQWRPLILESPRVSGVEHLDQGAAHLRVTGRTLPGRQWDVERELRRRIVLTSPTLPTDEVPVATGVVSPDEMSAGPDVSIDDDGEVGE